MKLSISHVFRVGLSATLGVAALGVLTATAQVRPTHRPDVPDFDERGPAAGNAADATAHSAKAHLQAQVPDSEVNFDVLLGSPRMIQSKNGFLTGLNGLGRGVSAKAAAGVRPNDPHGAIKAFINEHADLFGHDATELDSARIKREYVDQHNGLRTVVWEQQLDGIPVFEGVLKGHVTRNGELATLSSQFVPQAAKAADAGTPNRAALERTPPVTAAEAVAVALRNIGEREPRTEVVATPNPKNETDYQMFRTPQPAFARQVWLPQNRSTLRLAWEVFVTSHTTSERFRLVVDAQNAKVWLRNNLTKYLTDITFRVYTSDSPSPFSPGLQTPGTFQPPLTQRSLVTLPALDTVASPEGWIPDGGNTTTGNNTDTFSDRDFNGQPDVPRPVGVPDRVFDFPLDLTQDPTNYIDAATVQMFYWVNWYHDKLYQLGFNEASGNYQENNFGRGGLGGDSITAWVQAGANVGFFNNAFFMPAPDGIHGAIAMFLWDGPNPARDGDLDADVIMHEATHGTSERLVGGGVLISALQSAGMGEGWSDFYSLSLNSGATDDPDAAYQTGGYATYRLFGLTENYYFGIRHFPYCTDMQKNPFTFKDIDPAQISPHLGVPRSPIYPFFAAEADEVHHQGEVWCVTLWEVRANLIRKHGFAGNQLMLQLVTDGMKLSPANPTFLESRDAILLADRIDNAGANASDIWKGFAKRGMGTSAKVPPNNTTRGVVEAFDMPGISVDRVVVGGGNGNGLAEPNECDDLQVSLFNNAGYLATGVSARLVSLTPGVLVVQPFSAYPPLPDGSTNVNLTPFRISIAPSFVCGLPINLSLVIKSDQATSTNLFTLESGMTNGLPLRFDSYTLTPIPDVGTTNSFLQVSNVDFAITRMTVSLQINHTFDADLVLRLVSPDGTTNLLSRNRGSSGQNYGLACAPDSRRTTFDDGALVPIGSGTPPFLGSYRPEQPLAIYAGKFGTNVNGLWQLIMSDTAAQDTGFLSCWSLIFIPTTCTDGGGECPGADLAVGLDAAPDPVMIGNNLIYTISVTNYGPSTAKNVSVSQLLPGGVVFVDAIASQGSWSQSGGVLTATLGRMAASATATVTVIVMPTVVGTVTSSVTVSSEQTDFNPGNNTAYSATRVSPPTADLAVDLRAAPNSLVVGASLVYTLSVTNFGPATASGVTVTNELPPQVVVTDISLTQGDYSIVSNTITFFFNTVPNGSVASAAISTRPLSQGTLTATAVVAANQFDPVSANNTATAVVAVGPAADLGLSLAAFPNPAVLSSNVTFEATVTNAGPNTATNVVLNGTLPAGASVVSTTASVGTVTRTGSSLVWSLGAMNAGAKAILTIVLGTSKVGTLTASANVAAAQADLNPANNSATVSAEVTLPFINIVGAGASVTNESIFPPNGSIEIGETVTVLFRLQNIGNIQNTNLTATLLATGGVTSPSGSQSYGIMDSIGIPGVLPVARPFTFTAAGTNGGTIAATLHLQDAGGYSTNVTFTFGLPTIPIFANTNAITIPSIGSASPYPSTITVSGVTGQVGKVTATLAGFTHTYPHDVSVLLVGPTGGARALLMSHVADLSSATALNLTFDDFAPLAMPDSGYLLSGAWKPTAYAPSVSFPGVTPAGPYPSSLSAFTALNPNGTWSLYVIDDHTGDAGQIASGWNLAFTSLVPVNLLADLGVSGSTSSDSATVGSDFTYTFVVTNNGPNSATGVTLTNALPAGVAFVSVTSSQGNCVVNNGVVTANLATLPAGQVATVVVTVTPAIGAFGGSLTSSASVWAFENDIQQLNNRVTLVSPLSLPVTDVALDNIASAAVVTVGSNLTYTITATNSGPGKALNVVVTDPLPASLSYVSASTSQGAVSYANGTLTASVGDLLPGTTATITLSVVPTAAGLVANTAALTTDSSDSNAANNSATASVTAENPGPKLVVSGVRLLRENLNVNGAIDPGETVTIAFSLSNTGLLDTVNLSATLLPTGGVLNPSDPANYGQVIHGGPAVAAPFTFTAGSPPNGVILATLQLRDNLNDLGEVTVVFNLPTLASVANTNEIIIPDHGPGLPYPSTIAISGMTGVVSKVKVTLAGLTHRFPSDVNALLVSPAGKNVLLMSHAGGGFSATNLNLTFDDSAAQPIPQATALVSTNYQPARYDKAVTFYPTAPAPPYGYQLAALNGDDANGTWSLYILDDAVGDGGSIANGWSLDVATVSPVSAPGEIPQPVLSATVVGDQFNLTVTGQPGATYQIQSSANLASWSTLTTQTATNGVIQYTDPIPPGLGQRFYRAAFVGN